MSKQKRLFLVETETFYQSLVVCVETFYTDNKALVPVINKPMSREPHILAAGSKSNTFQGASVGVPMRRCFGADLLGLTFTHPNS